MIFNPILAMNNSLSTQSASPKATRRTRWAPVLLALVAIVAALFVASCKKGGAGAKPADVDYYTCTMHRSVKKHSPTDKCPICSMDLTPVKKRDDSAVAAQAQHAGHAGPSPGAMPQSDTRTNEDKPSEFSVPVERQQQIGVTYATIEKRSFTHPIRAVGMAAYDKQRHWDYVTRVEGYVKELFVFSRGELVEKGAPLVTIYSPDLLTAQSELVNVLKMRDETRTNDQKVLLESTERLVESAKR